jgi:hypothetical protein
VVSVNSGDKFKWPSGAIGRERLGEMERRCRGKRGRVGEMVAGSSGVGKGRRGRGIVQE